MSNFEEAALAALAQSGVTIDRHGKYVRLVDDVENKTVSDEQLRYMNERTPNLDIEGRLQCYWVNDLADVSETLERMGESAPWPFRTAFWIRLHGVISDMRTETMESFRRIGVDPTTHVATGHSLLALQLEKFRRIEAVRLQFSEDELIYADYLRQTNGHPTQRGYDVRWSNANGGQVNDRRRIATVGRELTVADLNKAIYRVLHANKVDGRINEDVVAADFAARVRGVIHPLLAIMKRLSTPG